MTKYTDNDHYENDKAKLFNALESFSVYSRPRLLDRIWDLLQQSKWIGSDFSIKPIPVVKDKHGKLVTDYKSSDWFRQLNEELDEVKCAATVLDLYDSTVEDLAEELQDLITVCTSMLQQLGFDESKRNHLCKQVNDKNRNCGYFE